MSSSTINRLSRLGGRHAWMALFMFLLVAGIMPAAMAQAPPALPGLEGSGDAADAAKPVDAQSIEDAISVLEDPAKRAEMTDLLRTLLAAQRSQEAPAPDTAIEQGLDALDDRLARVSEVFLDVGGSLDNIPALVNWLQLQVSKSWRQGFWTDELFRLGMVFLAGIVAMLITHLAVRHYFGSYLTGVPGRSTTGLSRRVLRVVLGAMPQFAFILMVLLTLGLIPGDPVVREIARTAALGMLLYALVLVIARFLFAPRTASYRVLPVEDHTAWRAYRRVRILAFLAIWGGVLLEAARILGMPWTLHSFLTHTVYAILALLAIATVQQWRVPIARGIGALGQNGNGTLVRFLTPGRLAAGWHVLAIAWIVVLYLVWALSIPGGFQLLARGTLVTIVAFIIARLVLMRVEVEPAAAAPEGPDQPVEETEKTEAEPGRIEKLGPAARGGLALTIRLVALLVVAEAWGLGLFPWLVSGGGNEFLRAAAKLVIIAVAAAVAWKLITTALTRSVEAKDEAGNLRYSGRTRTLLQIVRNLLLALIVLIVLMLVLSEIGVDAGPLLAGAGVIGLAIGFGSQKLVQDVIGGSFILLGDTIRVGDVVDLSGKAGVVEALSIRTVTLRSYNGDVHTVPYGSIDVVTNLTRDFSFAVFEIGIDYDTNVDQAMEIMREVGDKMRLTWPWYRKMVLPLEIAGVDRLADSAVIIKARIKTRPGDQWDIMREYQRRLRLRFAELGISFPYPARQIVIRDSGDPSRAPSEAVQAAAGSA
jgi:moderate conductance mechanosensitive channel